MVTISGKVVKSHVKDSTKIIDEIKVESVKFTDKELQEIEKVEGIDTTLFYPFYSGAGAVYTIEDKQRLKEEERTKRMERQKEVIGGGRK